MLLEYVLYLLIIAVLAFLLWMMREARLLSVERIRILSKTDFKLIHISDIHISLLRVNIKKVCGAVLREAPDAIVFTGDYIDRKNDISKVIDVFKCISKVAVSVNSSCVIVGCLGNHDYKALMDSNDIINKTDVEHFVREINAAGVHILSNETVIAYAYDRKAVSLTGLDEARYKLANIEKAVMSLEEAAKSKTGKNDSGKNATGVIPLKIGFGHNPDNSLDIPEGTFNIFLCGHFHGGQIWTPFGIEFRALRGEKLCRQKIIKGHHIINGMHLYINRGLGNVLIPLRFRSRPEIAVICFKK